MTMDKSGRKNIRVLASYTKILKENNMNFKSIETVKHSLF